MSDSVAALAQLFESVRAENRAALIGYLPAGFPTKERSIALIKAMIEGGVDIVEVGFPYSDPIMDGPVIQRASEIAIAAGFHTQDIFDIVKTSSVPTLVMSYWNPIAKYGVNRFAQGLADVGSSGMITPDLTIEESGEWESAAKQFSLDRVFVVAPNTNLNRLRQVSQRCSGFIYAASLMGVTGARSEVSRGAIELVERIRSVSSLPICVGLGISNGPQAQEVARYADGVIVGSAFIKLILDEGDEAASLRKVRDLATELAHAVRRS